MSSAFGALLADPRMVSFEITAASLALGSQHVISSRRRRFMIFSDDVSRRRLLTLGAATAGVGLTGLLPRGASAQSYPTRPIRWICYQPAGGSADLTTRAFQPFLDKHGLKTQIDYVTGGSGNIARTQAYTARGDGYTLLTETNPATVLNEVVAGAAYKVREFEPILGWSIDGHHIATKKDGEIKTLADIARIGRQRTLSAATISRGSSSHLQLLLMQEAMGIQMNIVHFTGSAQAYPQAMGGNVDLAIGSISSGARVRDRLHIVGVFRGVGEAAAPDVPTMKSAGFDVIEVNQVWYVTAPPKTPADRISKLKDIFSAAYDDAEFAPMQKRAGFEVLEKVSAEQIRAANATAYTLAEKYKDQLQG
jgi:tripartite-type tricarboxylate transporter receptor subunit TctC